MSFGELIRESAQGEQQPVALEGVVKELDGDTLVVTIPSFDDGRHSFRCTWGPRIGTPAEGDRCLVVVSDEGDTWVVAVDTE
jgi:hypothetical protein